MRVRVGVYSCHEAHTQREGVQPGKRVRVGVYLRCERHVWLRMASNAWCEAWVASDGGDGDVPRGPPVYWGDCIPNTICWYLLE